MRKYVFMIGRPSPDELRLYFKSRHFMERNEIIQVITDTLKLVRPGSTAVAPADHLLDDVGLGSLDMVELVARIEEKFQVPIGDDDYRNLYSIDRIADYLIAHTETV
jgi:acyl carrier protein